MDDDCNGNAKLRVGEDRDLLLASLAVWETADAAKIEED
jgi:hypothetical protein